MKNMTICVKMLMNEKTAIQMHKVGLTVVANMTVSGKAIKISGTL